MEIAWNLGDLSSSFNQFLFGALHANLCEVHVIIIIITVCYMRDVSLQARLNSFRR